jgi:hypothetical protein
MMSADAVGSPNTWSRRIAQLAPPEGIRPSSLVTLVIRGILSARRQDDS